MLDINNLGHFIGGLATAYVVIYAFHRRFRPLSVAGMGIPAGIAVNLIWELAVDVGRVWPSMADSAGFDWKDPFLRGGIGALLMAVYYLIKGRK